MIRNYLKTAIRSLLKNKGFTTLNVLGLAVGLATCLLIVMYVVDELGYDRYNKNASRIFRITEVAKVNNHEAAYAGSEKPMMSAVRDFPEVEKIARLIPTNILFLSPQKFYVKKGNTNIQEKKLVYGESGLFDIFTLPVVAGKPCLDEPYTAVVTESTAKKYFGHTQVVGQVLSINDSTQYKITAVIKDMPLQSHFNFDFFLSYSSIPEYQQGGWGYGGVHQYVLLKPGADIKKIEKEMQTVAYNNYPSSMHENGNFIRYELTPVTDLHLRSHSQDELMEKGNIQYIYIFSLIAVFILLIACVNFMNLSTARSASRAREVGVRKVLGSARKYLVYQFLSESVLITLLATVIAVLLATLFMPLFNQLAVKNLSFNTDNLYWLLPGLLISVLVIGLLAGLYPAFVLSAFKPVEVLKGKFSAGFKGRSLRSFLVVFQFSISIFQIIGTLVIFNQLNYIRNKNLGFSREQMLVIKNGNLLGAQAGILKENIKQIPGVTNTTMSDYLPTGEERNVTGLFPALPIDIRQDVLSEFWPVDEDYIGGLGIQLISGRNFSSQMASDSSGMIVNEAFVKRFGFKDPLNKTIYRDSYGIQAYHIVGVVKDFNYSSLREEIKPLAIVYGTGAGSITAKVNTTQISTILSQVEKKWKALAPHSSFSYSFMDSDFEAAYRAEQRIGQLFISFSSIAILIACLGLFGLAAYAAEQRNKEIGIRKVLGASISGIVAMLSLDFIKWVAIAIFIAAPFAWLTMNKWLEGFSYRQQIQWWILPVAGCTAIFIAWFTISFQAIKAALSNPIDRLRNE